MSENIISIIPFDKGKFPLKTINDELVNKVDNFKSFFKTLKNEMELKFDYFEKENVWRDLNDSSIIHPRYDDSYISFTEGICIRFGIDCVKVIFPINIIFVRNKAYQKEVVDVTKKLTSVFEASFAFITTDTHQVVCQYLYKNFSLMDSLNDFYIQDKKESLDDFIAYSKDNSIEKTGGILKVELLNS